ncbi:hypothetical protein ACFQ3Z_43770 [Streptomyces nogalater]
MEAVAPVSRIVFLPLFFAYSGLNTDFTLLSDGRCCCSRWPVWWWRSSASSVPAGPRRVCWASRRPSPSASAR